MGVRKIIAITFLVFLIQTSYCQVDTSSFNFEISTPSIPQELNQELQQELIFEFDYLAVSSFQNCTIELIGTAEGEIENQIFFASYENLFLLESEMNNNGVIRVPLGFYSDDFVYLIVFRVFDSHGHQVLSYSKTL